MSNERYLQKCLPVDSQCAGKLLEGRALYIDTSGRAQYASTRRFYERCGYHQIASLPDFYAPEDPKQIYWRALGK